MEEQAVLRNAIRFNAPTPAKGEIPVDAISYPHELNDTETNLALSEEREDPSDMEEVPTPDEYKYKPNLKSIADFKNPRTDLGNPNSIDFWAKIQKDQQEKAKSFAESNNEGKFASSCYLCAFELI